MSAVKNHFVITIDSAKCNHCTQSLKISAGSTKGLWYHLEAKHPKIFEKIKDEKKTIVKPPKSNEKLVSEWFVRSKIDSFFSLQNR